jgi:hypothetical protein
VIEASETYNIRGDGSYEQAYDIQAFETPLLPGRAPLIQTSKQPAPLCVTFLDPRNKARCQVNNEQPCNQTTPQGKCLIVENLGRMSSASATPDSKMLDLFHRAKINKQGRRSTTEFHPIVMPKVTHTSIDFCVPQNYVLSKSLTLIPPLPPMFP